MRRSPHRHPASVAAACNLPRRLKSFNKRGTSYGLKHIAEHDMGYCTNGVFIAAAIAEGFRVRREGRSPNAVFNISTAAWRRRGSD
jgi:hypothetical protein